MGMTWGEWSVALQTVGMVVVLPVALWMLVDATKRTMPHRGWWIGAWAATTLAISLLLGAVVVAAYLIRRPSRLPTPRLAEHRQEHDNDAGGPIAAGVAGFRHDSGARN